MCAFAGEEDVDMRGKVVIRLQDITELQSQLESCMTGGRGCRVGVATWQVGGAAVSVLDRVLFGELHDKWEGLQDRCG